MRSKDSKLSPLVEQPTLTAGLAGKLGEIVVFIDGQTEAPSILEFAGALAEEHAARLIGVFMQPGPTVTTARTFARGKGIRDVMEVQDRKIKEIEAYHRGLFEALCVVRVFSRGRSGDHCPI